MSGRTMHMCISVRGVLRWPDRLVRQWFKGCVTGKDGRKLETVQEIRDAFMDELAQGREVVPYGAPCEGFDYKKGCPGHPWDEPARPATPGEETK